MARQDYFVSAEALKAELDAGADIVLLDIRFTPGGPDLYPEYEAGHIPGAVFVDLGKQLSRPGTGTEGRRPLPRPESLQETIRALGIDEHSKVVVYDNNNGLTAGRGWWVLTWAGVPNVRLLDGGYAAWLRAGGAVSTDAPTPRKASAFVVKPGQLPTLGIDEAAELPAKGILLDARGTGAYEGTQQDASLAKSGHIPGALNAGTRLNLSEEGLLRPEAELEQRFAEFGVGSGKPVGAYCGGGVAAAHEVLVLKSLGIDAALFVGSWSAWVSDPDRPVATGPQA
jgi:thiosulfate/3-mercaptopyruvate sulfurtransferase